jgi:hypothetical protein
MKTHKRLAIVVSATLAVVCLGGCTVTGDGVERAAPQEPAEEDPSMIGEPFPETEREPMPGENSPDPSTDFPEGVMPP